MKHFFCLFCLAVSLTTRILACPGSDPELEEPEDPTDPPPTTGPPPTTDPPPTTGPPPTTDTPPTTTSPPSPVSCPVELQQNEVTLFVFGYDDECDEVEDKVLFNLNFKKGGVSCEKAVEQVCLFDHLNKKMYSLSISCLNIKGGVWAVDLRELADKVGFLPPQNCDDTLDLYVYLSDSYWSVMWCTSGPCPDV